MNTKNLNQLYYKSIIVFLAVCFVFSNIMITTAYPDTAHKYHNIDPNMYVSEKLTTGLINIIEEYNNYGFSYNSSFPIVNSLSDGNKVFVYITLEKGTDIELIKSNVLEITNFGDDSVVTAWVSIDKLAALSKLDGVSKIRQVSKPIVNIGSVTTAGDVIHRTDIVRSTYLQNGAGIKIGVISNGVDAIEASKATGDLPADVTVLRNSIGDNEGIAMMEIIYDMAPGAKLYFHDYGNSVYDFNRAIDALVNAGCNIIVDDVTWPDEPFFEDGVVAKHVAQVIETKNVVFISSAGNSAQRHYQGLYVNDGNNYHDKIFYLPAGTSYQIYMQWDDKMGASSNDYDLYVYDKNGEVIAYSNDIQDGNDDPFEWTLTPNLLEDAYIKIQNKDGQAQPRNLEFYAYPSSPRAIEDRNLTAADSIFGHPAVKNVITVGAVSATNPDYNNVEPYSSRGPVTLRYPSTTIIKPDVIAVDRVAVSGAGNFGQIFPGTSASAAHIAAIAAQIWGSNKDMSASQVRQAIFNNAIPGTSQNNVRGFGLSDALNFFTNSANSVNRPPVLEPLQDITVNLNQPVSILLMAHDDDNNPLVYSTNASFGTLNGNIFTWTPSATDFRNSTIAFSVSDGILTDTKTLNIKINNQGQLPIPSPINSLQLNPIGNKNINENQTLSFVVSAVGASNISYVGLNLPTGAIFNNINGNFTWTPTYNQAGIYNLQFMSISDNLSDSEDIVITVNNVDKAPIFEQIPVQNITEGQLLHFKVSATDEDGDIIHYTASGLPNGANFNSITGDFFWTPSIGMAGEYNINVTAISNALMAQQTVHINVLPSLINSDNTTDAILPSILNVYSNDITSNSVTIAWVNSPTVASVELKRNNIVIGNILNPTTQYIDRGLISNTTYNYTLTPFGINGTQGELVNLIVTTSVDNVTVPPNDSSSGSSDDSSGSSSDDSSRSSSGRGSASISSQSEDFDNLIITDTSSQYLWKDKNATYLFNKPQNDIRQIDLLALKNSGEVVSTVEILRSKSKLVNNTPDGFVYNYMNIWLGKGGFNTSDSVKNISIQFRVNNSWLDTQGLNIEDVRLQRYNSGKWELLPTQYVGQDQQYLLFKSYTPGLSPFAITADEQFSTVTSVENPTIIENVSNTAATKSLTFPLIILVLIIIVVAVLYFRRNQ